MYVLGTDVGTTGTITILFDEQGKIAASSYKGYETLRDRRGFTEQNAEDWWSTVVDTVRECTEEVADKNDIKAIAVSTQGGSMVPVGADGKALLNAAVWMDRRGAKQQKDLLSKKSNDFFYRKTGWNLGPGLNLIQIKWLKENNPEVYTGAYKFISTAEYINYRLTGEFYCDIVNAGITQLLNISEKKWDNELLGMLGLDEKKLGTLVVPGEKIGTLRVQAAEQLGLSKETLVIAGGHDQYCAALGTGAIREGDTVLSTGTAWVLMGIMNKPVYSAGFNPGNHVVNGKYALLSSFPTGGAAMEWFRNNFANTAMNEHGNAVLESFLEIDGKAAEKEPGAEGVCFYPNFLGGSSHVETAGASITGITLKHDKYSIARALMEGVVYETDKKLVEIQKHGIGSDSLRVVGGAAKSMLWMEITANVTGKRIIIPEINEAACSGAAIIAGTGAGIFKDYDEGYKRINKQETVLEPDESAIKKYVQLKQEYYCKEAHIYHMKT